MNKRYLDRKIKHITDADLFTSLRLDLPGLEGVKSAVQEKDYLAAGAAWRDHLANRVKEEEVEEAGWRGDLDRENVLREADLIVARDIKCWGGVRIQYDGEIDFSRNLGGSSNYGFHYFGWIAPLGPAYRLTRDEKYARAFVEIFMQWYRQRDLVKGDHPHLDVIWYELGCGARAHAFTNLYFTTIGSEAAASPEFHLHMLRTMLGHGRWVYAYETAYAAGNWQVYANSGLLKIGLSYPEFRDATRWVKRGLKWVVAHTRQDVYADGCHKERAPHYHLGVADSFFDIYRSLAGVRGVSAQRRKIGDAVGRMLSWTVSMTIPSGHSPTVGDSEYELPQGQFLRAGLVLGKPELLWASKAPGKEIKKVAREVGVKKIAKPRAPARPTYHRKESGFIIVRSGWREDDLYFALNYGPYGGGHSHAEALAFQMWADGRPLAVDCGRGVSYDDPLHQTWYKTPYAHNMVIVDGAAPSIKGRRGRLLFWKTKGDVDFLGLTHTGYAEQGVGHRRYVLLNRSRGYAVLLDLLSAKSGEHQYEWTLNSPLLDFRMGRGRAVSPGLCVAASEPEQIEGVRFSKVKMALPLEGRSTWGQDREDGTNLRFVRRGGSLAFHVLLMPLTGQEDVRFAVTQSDPKSRHRLRVGVATSRFRHEYAVDCSKGDVTKG